MTPLAKDPVMLITGTRKGIGRSLAEYYVGTGFHVVGCSREQSDFAHENYDHFGLDVADEAAVVDMFAEVRRKYGRLDVLLNNAGIASMNWSRQKKRNLLPRASRVTVATDWQVTRCRCGSSSCRSGSTANGLRK